MALHAVKGGVPSALVGDQKIFSLLERLASDPRMQPIWIFLSPYSTELRERFVSIVVWSAVEARATPAARSRIRGMIRDIAKARSALKALRELGSKPIVISGTLELFVADYTKTLQGIEYVLFHSERVHRADLVERGLPRKDRGVTTARAAFMRRMVFWIKELFGKPRYEDVATLANVIFDIGDDPATAESARAATRKSGL